MRYWPAGALEPAPRRTWPAGARAPTTRAGADKTYTQATRRRRRRRRRGRAPRNARLLRRSGPFTEPPVDPPRAARCALPAGRTEGPPAAEHADGRCRASSRAPPPEHQAGPPLAGPGNGPGDVPRTAALRALHPEHQAGPLPAGPRNGPEDDPRPATSRAPSPDRQPFDLFLDAFLDDVALARVLRLGDDVPPPPPPYDQFTSLKPEKPRTAEASADMPIRLARWIDAAFTQYRVLVGTPDWEGTSLDDKVVLLMSTFMEDIDDEYELMIAARHIEHRLRQGTGGW
mmetsp:Transcript_51158/g.154872  ORF Transcript_51158/g.154872 Transcript_51158/m.154872 type:complete len:287 (-) Transcript_51158:319-1179(-)